MYHIVIPTYNRENTVIRSIKSVLIQNNSNFIIYIIDDWSIDNTKERIKPYLEKYKWKILYFFKENWWVWSARNLWIEKALFYSKNINNDIIVFLDSDDELAKDAFLNYTKYLNKYKDISIYKFLSKDQNWNQKSLIDDNKIFIAKKCDLLCWYKIYWEFDTIIKLNIFNNKNYRYPENVNWWESLLWFSLIKKYNFIFINKYTRIYHTWNNWLTRKILNNSNILNFKKISYEMIKTFEEDYLECWAQKQLWIQYLVYARMLILSWNKVESINYFIKWIKYNLDFKRIFLYLISTIDYKLILNNILIKFNNILIKFNK